MPKPKHSSLWPSSLIGGRNFDIKGFLETQASDLKSLVDNAFDVVIEPRTVKTLENQNLNLYSFTIKIPKSKQSYQLFSARMIGNTFPARIVAPHLPQPRQIVLVSDRAELEQCLRDLFHDPGTTKLVIALADEARSLGDAADTAPVA